MFAAKASLLTRPSGGGGSFVTRDSGTGNLMLNGDRFRWAGPNAHFALDESTTGYGETYDGQGLFTPNHTHLDALLSSAVSMNATVIRSGSTLTIGKTNAVQPTLGSFNSAALEPVDYVISQCASLGIRIIFPLVDNYNFFTGGKFTYCTLNGVTPDGGASQFFTNSTVIASYKAHISYVLDHVNTYTGVAYKNDPTILAWETGNELENGTGAVPNAAFVDWTDEISEYIKVTKGAQQLVADGKYGLTEDGVTYDTASLALPYVDLYSNHSYDEFRTPTWVVNEATACHNADKAFYIGEYTWLDGPNWTLTQMITAIEGSTYVGSDYVDGDAYWRLLPEDNDHGDGFALHYPGDNAGMITRVGQLSNHAAAMAA